MDSTKKLCHKLDELGVEYVSIGGITNWGHAEYDELADGSDTRLIVLGATPEQAIAATAGTEPDEQDMLKLHDRMNAELIKFERALGVEHVDGAAVVPFVARMHEIIEDAATVGRGNLTAEQVREAIMSADRWRKPMGDTGMTNTHLIIRDDGWQAIADELNATVGAGTCTKTCHDLGGTGGYSSFSFVCSECKCELKTYGYYDDYPVMFHADKGYAIEDPKHCPNCGARVVSE